MPIQKLSLKSISSKISFTVLLCCLFFFTLLFSIESTSRLDSIYSSAMNSARSNIDLLEAVHTQSMLHRQSGDDFDPAVNVLNGTFAQLSSMDNDSQYWLIMSDKVIRYQQKVGQTEIEPAVDSVDHSALASGQEVFEISEQKLRYTRPVRLGYGSAANPRCHNCHNKKMGIEQGEVIGAYSISTDLAAPISTLKQELVLLALALLGMALGLWLLIRALITKFALYRLKALNNSAKQLMAGNYEHIALDPDKAANDDISKLFLTLQEFRLSAIQKYQAEEQLVQLNKTLEDQVSNRTQELIIARDKAEAANRAKAKFIASMSHELRTPLNSVLGFSQLLEMDDLTEEQADCVQHISESGEFLLSMINDILNFARIEAHEIEINRSAVDIDFLVHDCCRVIGVLAQKNQLDISISGDNKVAAWTDSDKLKQILLNLLSNAVKYNRKHGSIRVHCQESATDNIRISVTDTGLGIPLDKQNEMFKPFSRLGQENSNIPGTGLGLVITKQLIEAMGGTIGFESTPYTGTTFWVELPHLDTNRATS